MKTKFESLFLIASLLLGTETVFGQDPIDRTLKPDHTIKSTLTGKTHDLYISFPRNYSAEDTIHYPVLYYLDGKSSFYSFHGARSLLDMGQEIEDIIIVGIGSMDRWSDYTPSVDSVTDSIFSARFSIPPGELVSGGGPEFLTTLREEIIPFVAKQYKVTNDRGIAGNSLGALFVGYCLFVAPDLFSRFGINSPAFWWNTEEMLGREKKFSETHQSLKAKVFVSVGSLEDEQMVPVITSFCYYLKSRNYEGLDFSWTVFDNETHLSSIPASVSRTLTSIYGVKNQ